MNIRTQNDHVGLYIAIETNDSALLKKILTNNDIDLCYKRKYHDYPLTKAAKLGYWQCVRLMAENPAKKKQRDLNEALFFAVKGNKRKTVIALLKAKATCNKLYKSTSINFRGYYTALYAAIENNNHRIAGLLLYYGADVNIKARASNSSTLNEDNLDVLNFASKITRKACLNKSWEEYENIKNKVQMKEVNIVIAQGVRQQESFLVALPNEVIRKIFKFVNNQFYNKVYEACYQLHKISFQFIIHQYSPGLYAKANSKKISGEHFRWIK